MLNTNDQTIQHSQRVAQYSLAIAKQLGLSDKEQSLSYLSGLLHDTGKFMLDERLINKPQELTSEEYETIKLHTVIAFSSIQELAVLFPDIEILLQVMRWHHERIDGSGYPDHLKGEEIPLIVRIVSVADVFDAMTSDRPYQLAKEQAEAFRELRKKTKYDQEIVKALISVTHNKTLSFRKIFSAPIFNRLRLKRFGRQAICLSKKAMKPA